MEEVVSVFQSNQGKYSLQTTRSWEFVGLEEKEQLVHMKTDDLLVKAKYGKKVIVGILDSGNVFQNKCNVQIVKCTSSSSSFY